MTDELSAISFAPAKALFYSSSVQVRFRKVRRSLKCCLQSLSPECLMPSALKFSSFCSEIMFGVHPSVCTTMVGLSSTAVSRPCCTRRVRSLVRFILMRKVSEKADTMSAFFCRAALDAAIDCMSSAYAIEVQSLLITSRGPFTLKMSSSSVSRAHNSMSMKQFQMSVLSTSPCPTPLFAMNGGAGELKGSVSVYDVALPCDLMCLCQCFVAAGLLMNVRVRELLSTRAEHTVCGMPNL